MPSKIERRATGIAAVSMSASARYTFPSRPAWWSARSRGQTASASPTTTASTCSRASSGMLLAWYPPMTTVFPRLRKASAIS